MGRGRAGQVDAQDRRLGLGARGVPGAGGRRVDAAIDGEDLLGQRLGRDHRHMIAPFTDDEDEGRADADGEDHGADDDEADPRRQPEARRIEAREPGFHAASTTAEKI